MSSPLHRAERTLVRYGYDVAAMPRLGDGVVRQVNLLQAYSELIAISIARAEFLGALAAAQVAEGDDPREGLIYTRRGIDNAGGDGDEIGLVEIGEDVRALIKLEGEERDRAARLIKDAMKIGIELHAAEAMRTYGASIAASLQAFARELGIDEHSAEVNRAAQRAVYIARRTLGQDEGDPDSRVGPALTDAERARALAPARR